MNVDVNVKVNKLEQLQLCTVLNKVKLKVYDTQQPTNQQANKQKH
eukprot:CAMPEP_0113462500 /NCGR_PEP_ID=MMETSP0014_2-20120614/12129_1 /TAXON_ID=2857 /ORGANISM="Nitzschia sp." /LENGTH=44 /DNA_ID=CAMNT_0000354375 /DNA_START=1099 /DNA_END=1233 /DNA_ORIENTATION=+ /assembly_acc=CAM_ASM_000159